MMRLILKSFFIVGLSIFCSNSASAAVTNYTFSDQLNVNGGGAGVTILDPSDPNFDGIGNNFTGTVTYDFTVKFDSYDSGTKFGGLQLYTFGAENTAIGKRSSSTDWYAFKVAANLGASDTVLNGAGSVPAPITLGVEQDFQVVISYVAGADDSAIVTVDGEANNLPSGDYSFNEIHVRAGNGSTQADYTNISLTTDGTITPPAFSGNTFTFADELDVSKRLDRSILRTSNPNFDGIDDTFEGTVTYEFTMSFDAFGKEITTSKRTFGGFQLYNAGSENLAVGESFGATIYNVFRKGGVSGAAGTQDLNGTGGVPLTIALNDPQTFLVTIDYVAGGDDTASVLFNGTTNNLGTGDYSFDEVRVRMGDDNDTKTAQADYTNMSLSIVPEPSTYVLMVLGFVLFGFSSRINRVRTNK